MKALEWLHTKTARIANYGLLLLSILLVLLVYPAMIGAGLERGWTLQVFLSLMLLSCLAAAIERTRMLALLILLLVVLDVVTWLLAHGGVFYGADDVANDTVRYASRFVVVALTAGILLRDVMRSTDVTVDTILGAVCIYLLIAMAWTELYVIIDIHDPQAFFASMNPDATRLDAHLTLPYFSLVTLSTLGYGDVIPVNGLARALAGVQAITGQLFIAIIVARLVASYVSPRARR